MLWRPPREASRQGANQWLPLQRQHARCFGAAALSMTVTTADARENTTVGECAPTRTSLLLSVMLRFLPYAPAHHEAAVRRLFHSNVPRYFVPQEEADLLDYLGSGHPYFVAFDGEEAVAAGGYALNGPHAALTWGMVHAARHGQGIGRAFTEFRLREAVRTYPHLPIEIETSQHTAAFYEKLGFRLVAPPQVDFWAPGLDLHRMRLEARMPVR